MNNIGNPDLIQQQFDLSAKCDELIREMAIAGEAYARAEYDYNRQKTATAFTLREREGLSATMIMQVLKGVPTVAGKRLERDLAKSKYDAIKESINITKLQLRLGDSQISREWGRNE